MIENFTVDPIGTLEAFTLPYVLIGLAAGLIVGVVQRLRR